MNETGRRVREQYADTGGFTDHVFAACSILGYAFVPRIRDLPSKRLYVFERASVPKRLRPLVGGKVNVDLIDRNWADILRVAATMAAGTMRPSQLLRKLAAYPRQNELAAALREVGRIERSLFMIEWTTDLDVRRRALVGLNKGEAHHALKRAINFHQRGELRDRTGEGQHYRIAGLNLLAAIIIYWNTLKLGDAVFTRRQAGLEIRELRIPILDCAAQVSGQTKTAYAKGREAATAIASAEAQLIEALGLQDLDLSPQKCYTRRFRDLEAAGRFGAEYFMPCKRRVLDALTKMPHQNVAAHATGIRDMWNPAQASRGEVVRNFDVTEALQPFLEDTKERQKAAEIGSAKKCFERGDVVISRLRSYLKEIAVVCTSGKPPSVGSSEFIVLRPRNRGLTAETLMVYLRSPLVQAILKWSQDGSNHPRFTEEDLFAIPVPDRVLGVQKQINRRVSAAREAGREAAKLLELAKTAIDEEIGQGGGGKGR